MYYYKNKANKVIALETSIKDDVRYKQSYKIWSSATEKEYQSYLARQNAFREIDELKTKLAQTDYVAIKIAEGVASKDEYATVLATRKSQRARINELENLI